MAVVLSLAGVASPTWGVLSRGANMRVSASPGRAAGESLAGQGERKRQMAAGLQIRRQAGAKPGERSVVRTAEVGDGGLGGDAAVASGTAGGGGVVLTEGERVVARRLRQREEERVERIGKKVADFLFVFGGLLDRPFGSGASIAAAGRVVIERVTREVEGLLREEESKEEGIGEEEREEGGQRSSQMVFELLRVMRLLTLDMQMIAAAVKDETLLLRLEDAKKHCKTAIQLANNL